MIQPRANAMNGMPEQVHHLATRGAHPEARTDAKNLTGVSSQVHQLHHDTGAEVLPVVSLEGIF
jgi:hypothetical protein